MQVNNSEKSRGILGRSTEIPGGAQEQAGSNAGKSAIILAAFFVVFLALTLIFSHSSLKKDLQRIDANTKEKMAVSK